MIVQTFPAEDVDPAIAALHPVLLHVVRIGKVGTWSRQDLTYPEQGKRDQELEPVPTHFHWRQVFEVCGRSGEVWVTAGQGGEGDPIAAAAGAAPQQSVRAGREAGRQLEERAARGRGHVSPG